MLTAEVIEPFLGVRDKMIYPEQFVLGDIVEGELAKTAIEAGWAIDPNAKPVETIVDTKSGKA